MVGPPSEDEHRAAMSQLKVAVVGLVGASAGLIAVQGDGTPLQVAAAVAGGLVVGALLLGYLVWITR